MGPRPSADHTLDRIDTDGDYAPDNCRWATKEAQSNNMRNNLPAITFRGKTLTPSQWSRRLGMSDSAVQQRLILGWSVREAVTIPKGGRRK